MISPPKRADLFKEALAPIEWMSTLVQFPTFSLMPKGDGRHVMLAPGYMTEEWSMLPLKQFLMQLNYKAVYWGLGRNTGQVDKLVAKMAEQIRQYQTQGNHSEPYTLIGWSLGGVISREVARLHPELVQEVITLGTPITGGPKYTVAAQQYATQQSLDLDAFEQHVFERNKLGFSQPVTAIYSKTDGVVSWEAAIDVYNPQARNIEVKATHFGIGANAKVWRIIAAILAEKPHEKPKPRTL